MRCTGSMLQTDRGSWTWDGSMKWSAKLRRSLRPSKNPDVAVAFFHERVVAMFPPSSSFSLTFTFTFVVRLQAHFENIQRISDATTLPYAMHCLRNRISEELDLSYLTDKLMKGKGQPNILTPNEKVELWERLKILSTPMCIL